MKYAMRLLWSDEFSIENIAGEAGLVRAAYTELECLTNERAGCYTNKGHQLSAD